MCSPEPPSLATAIGRKRKLSSVRFRNFTGKALELADREVSHGLYHSWYPVVEAVKKMEAVEPTSELGNFVRERSLFFLEAYLQV